jgi:hypothetical protein
MAIHNGTKDVFNNEVSFRSKVWINTVQLTAAIVTLLTSITAGTVAASKAVVVDSAKSITGFLNLTITGLFQSSAGAAAAAVAARLGATATEGLEIKVIDETVTLTNAVETDLTETVPAGAVILSVQANAEEAIDGDDSGDDGFVNIGIGVTADPDKYGKTGVDADPVPANTKINTIPDWAVLASEETVTIKACDAAGDAVTEKFAGSQSVRVRIVYAVNNGLDDA